ncbi:hypothetical protein [Gilvimarinus sp. 1_MG-2023]|uniref:hypothetical protein n=1 Tax=Gilvimarinus sp. 1_MG-2023 TaxID=3062638 RepID=UPI0026E3B59A|nr:hypothetical protein [Gilvimarinus sp. 1_MG-2023]MDO6747291.1 hypothetical protein [Gilvimarinus sp. 1_MG-2023]
MNIVVVIILVLVAAMVIGPVAMLRPSPGQKRRDNLRARARQNGLSVNLRLPPRASTDLEAPSHTPVYSLISKGHCNWFLLRTRYAHQAHLNDWWQFVANKPSTAVETFLVQNLDRLPKGVIGVGSQGSELVVFWREIGELEAVDTIGEFLQQLAECQFSSTSSLTSP